jgi:glycosyltransferase involved in cell wall biosynthesis
VKILFVLDKFTQRSGGADRLAKAAVDALLAAGHRVTVLQEGEQEAEEHTGDLLIVTKGVRRWVRDGDVVTIRGVRTWTRFLRAYMKSQPCNLVLTQNRLAPAAVRVGRELGLPTVILFHGYRCLSPTFFFQQDALTVPPLSFWNAPFKSKLKWPLVRRCLALYESAYRAADRVIVNSHYSGTVLQRFYGCDTQTLYPIIDRHLAGSSARGAEGGQGPVLFVKPQRIKGVERMISVASARPEIPFLVVGNTSNSIRRRLTSLPNVEYLPWTDEMDSVYSRSSVLLGPSQIPEPFGRVFWEAGMHGVPSVASNAGGIPEAIGKGGVLVSPNAPTEEWVEALERTRGAAGYSTLSKRASEHAATLAEAHTPERFVRLVVGQ